VDEILAIEEGKLKFAKRKLRVQRCKTIPGSSVSTSRFTLNAANKAQAQKSKTQSQPNSQARPSKKPAQQGQSIKPPVPIAMPKGDPKLGKKLVHLPKGERKQAKAANADRVARRLAKKKARMAMGTKGKDSNSGGKKRVRARKKANDKAKKGKTGKGKEKKGRVRSEKSLAKLNTKK
jgi:nucleolar protein 12